MYYYENLFDISFMPSLNCISSFVVLIMGAEVDGVSEERVTISFTMSFDENLFVYSLELCYLLRGAVILILIWDDKFHHVVFLSIVERSEDRKSVATFHNYTCGT